MPSAGYQLKSQSGRSDDPLDEYGTRIHKETDNASCLLARIAEAKKSIELTKSKVGVGVQINVMSTGQILCRHNVDVAYIS